MPEALRTTAPRPKPCEAGFPASAKSERDEAPLTAGLLPLIHSRCFEHLGGLCHAPRQHGRRALSLGWPGCRRGAWRSSYAWAWARIHARTSPTHQAEIAGPSFNGAGNVPSRTLRHKVAGLNGSGVVRVGCLGSRTSCDWRTSAESGSSSKLGIGAVARCTATWGVPVKVCASCGPWGPKL